MKADDFEDILRLYLIENELGLYSISEKWDDYRPVEITYIESISNKGTFFIVKQIDRYDEIKKDKIYLTDLLVFIATY